jgi:putative tryptophan/tyrosine transport system substrate-binding protein
MKRREFIALFGGAAVSWPVRGHTQKIGPVIGVIGAGSHPAYSDRLRALQEALAEMSYIEHRNVAFTYRWADGQIGRLPSLAADLVNLQVALIIATDEQSAHAAKSATAAIPIVFVSDEDHVKADVGSNSNWPAGNVTGVTCSGDAKLNVKRLELLHELLPRRRVIAVMGPSNKQIFENELADVLAAARAIDLQIVVVSLDLKNDFNVAFATVVETGAGAVMIIGSRFFGDPSDELVEQAASYRIPVMYDRRDQILAGGLISYSCNLTRAYGQAGTYAGQILQGIRPFELPVQRSPLQLVVNLKTANGLDLTIPPTLLARADEVIE